MVEVESIIEKIKTMPREHLKEVAEFIKSLESRKDITQGEDPLSSVIGICKGPSDLSERHDRYAYR